MVNILGYDGERTLGSTVTRPTAGDTRKSNLTSSDIVLRLLQARIHDNHVLSAQPIRLIPVTVRHCLSRRSEELIWAKHVPPTQRVCYLILRRAGRHEHGSQGQVEVSHHSRTKVRE